MNYEALLGRENRAVKVGIAGIGDFGAGLLARSKKIAGLDISLICDKDRSRMDVALSACDMNSDGVAMVEKLEDGQDVPFDLLVEATGNPEAAAENAEWALSNKRHVVMVSKEAAIVIGPILHQMARRQGLVYTEVDGDQPGLLIGLISWARTLGLKIRVAGKASEYDFVLAEDDTLVWKGRRFPGSGLKSLWRENGRGWRVLAHSRRQAVLKCGVPLRTVPDYCEMGLVANATGFIPDRPELHTPLLRPIELAEAFQLESEGGMLKGEGRIDVFNCLRSEDEMSFAGGVFVLVECDDAETWSLLQEKGHVVARNGRTALLYNPQHLLGVEAPISILCAGLLGLPTGAQNPRPVLDLAARTNRDFGKGEVLAITDPHHHEVLGLQPELVRAGPIGDRMPCPYYLAAGRSLNQDVPSGMLLQGEMLDAERTGVLHKLRIRQDRFFNLTE